VSARRHQQQGAALQARKRLLALSTAAAPCLLVAALGWMHTPAARPVLRALGLPCPVKSATAAQVSALRERGLQGLRGERPAPSRPSPGLQLGTTEQAAREWAARSGGACEEVVKGYRFLRCRALPAAALGIEGPAVSELWLSFGPRGTLIGIDVYRRGLDGPGEVAAFEGAAARLERALGKPPIRIGDASPAALFANAYSTARVQYRYADYVATVTAANLPHAGLAVREQYLDAAAGGPLQEGAP
jgi:hypothetical protein